MCKHVFMNASKFISERKKCPKNLGLDLFLHKLEKRFITSIVSFFELTWQGIYMDKLNIGDKEL